MNFQESERQAVERVREWISRPEPIETAALDSENYFDPWEMINSRVYGSYSSAFDQCAINVLEELATGVRHRTDLGADMFREMLCVADLCDYGTSPRVCFPVRGFKEIIPEVISKWKRYYEIKWEEPFQFDSTDR